MAFPAISPGLLGSTWKVSSTWKYLLRLEPQKLTHPRGGTDISYYLGNFDCTDCPNLTSLENFQDEVQVSIIMGACLCSERRGNAWSNTQPNSGCLASNNIGIDLVCHVNVANRHACPSILRASAAHCWSRRNG